MDKKINRKENDDKLGKAKSFQEVSDEIADKPRVKKKQPTPQPKDFDEIEY